MASGGARNRSGPKPDPNSKRSERRAKQGTGSEITKILPREGFNGTAPKWPMPKCLPRERALWKKLWTYPQAAAWIDEPWRWLTIAHYIHWLVKSEAPEAPASILTQVLRLADSIGLTPAGLKENGWVIDSIETRGDEAKDAVAPAEKPSRRLRVIDDAAS